MLMFPYYDCMFKSHQTSGVSSVIGAGCHSTCT